MSIVSLVALSFGMSMDAFASAIAKGATQKQASLGKAFQAGLIFGVIEGIAPIVGWLLGNAVNDWLSQMDHWVAFVLLSFLAIRFIRESLSADGVETDGDTNVGGLGLMIITAIATSIDSLVVGVSLAFLEVNIYLAAFLIGLATTVMATLGLYLGNRLGLKFGKIAMFVGGLVLFGIGATILYDHLSV